MLLSVLSLPIEVASKLDSYAIASSTDLTPLLKAHYEWTRNNFADADRSSSLLQAQWMSQRARDRQAKRVLDIGCYTGLSAVAWYEGTRETQAEIYTIEHDPGLAARAREMFKTHGCHDRVQVIEGTAEKVIAELTGPFDIIFVDLEFSAYRSVVEQILDRSLLGPGGIILVDNVFARGFAVDMHNVANIEPGAKDHWIDAGRLVQDFNSFVANDPRIVVTMLPFFDGVSEIRLKN